jgi:hypothetical protein
MEKKEETTNQKDPDDGDQILITSLKGNLA